MEEKNLTKWIYSLKNKFKKDNKKTNEYDEYAFNTKELLEINKDNIEKIKNLKKEVIEKKKDTPEEFLNDSIIALNEEIKKEAEKEINIPEKEPHENSFMDLEKEYQDLIMTKWQEIDINEIDKDIIEGKDLLNHNYNITYADESLKYINEIRKKYEIVICYLIGFNNEKQGLYNKTIFTSKKENEWKCLNKYIKLLEKIRNFKIKNQ